MPDSNAVDKLANSYLRLRRLLGVLGLFLPFILILGVQLIFNETQPGSISAYYYTGMGNVFVAIMFTVGLFLISYPGYDFKDDWVANICGLGAIGVALFPTASTPTVSLIHGISTAVFFLAAAVMSGFLFTMTTKGQAPSSRKLKRNVIFRICAVAIAISIILILARAILPTDIQANLEPYRPVFWLETVGVIGFGISWLVKGRALLGDPA